MTPVLAVPFIALAALLGACTWVYRDAQDHATAGTPIVLQIGSFRVDTPQAWSAGCLALFVLFFPLYLAARNT